jgi:hypothetical protein
MTSLSKANATKFQIVFPLMPELSELTTQKQFSLNIIDGVLPSLTLGVEEIPWKGGLNHYEMGGLEFGQWTTQFIIDENFTSWLVLSDWIFSIYNGRNVLGRDDKNYMTDAHLLILDNYNNIVFKIIFENIFPQELDEVKMSYQEGEGLLIGTVTFIYDRFYKEENKN